MGLALDARGKFVESEILGPANIHEWTCSYQVSSTACMMLGILSPAVLVGYCTHIKNYAADVQHAGPSYTSARLVPDWSTSQE